MQKAIAMLALGLIGTACGKPRPEPSAPVPLASRSATQSVGTTPANGNAMSLDGKTLYESLCSSCYGSLGQSTIARASFAAMETAIGSIPEMQALPNLDAEQIQSLVDAVSKIPPGRAKSKS